MPDRRRHRGKHPEDDRLFASAQIDSLRSAVSDCGWLRTRDYSLDAVLKLVGDRYRLTARQRMGVRRSTCSDQALAARRAARVKASLAGEHIAIDGYNLLITLESALSGGLILVGRDGCHRDLASVHGTYRKVEETLPALKLIMDHLAVLSVGQVTCFLDAPVSNSGRLRKLIEERAGERAPAGPAWSVELVADPDAVLVETDAVVVTTDSVVLDRCERWADLAADIVRTRVPNAWCVDLRQPDDGSPG